MSTPANMGLTVSKELDDVLTEGMDNSFTPKLIKIEIIHPNATFSMEGMSAKKEISGIILSAKRNRLFFPKFQDKSLSDEIMEITKKRPFCSSKNANEGILVPLSEEEWLAIPQGEIKNTVDMLKQKIAHGGLKCKLCPLSAWGSVSDFGQQGRGQACVEMRRLLIWWRGVETPIFLTIPTTSINAWDTYASSLNANGVAFNKAHTSISLIPSPKATGSMKWSVCQFAFTSLATQEEINALDRTVNVDGIEMPLAKALLNSFLRKPVEIEDYMETETTNGTTSEDGF